MNKYTARAIEIIDKRTKSGSDYDNELGKLARELNLTTEECDTLLNDRLSEKELITELGPKFDKLARLLSIKESRAAKLIGEARKVVSINEAVVSKEIKGKIYSTTGKLLFIHPEGTTEEEAKRLLKDSLDIEQFVNKTVDIKGGRLSLGYKIITKEGDDLMLDGKKTTLNEIQNKAY